VFGVTFDNLLAPGRYFAGVQVARRGGGQILLDRNDRAATFVSTGSRSTGGVVDLPHEVEVRRPAGGPPVATTAVEETKA
jgi:hypothetical protein